MSLTRKLICHAKGHQWSGWYLNEKLRRTRHCYRCGLREDGT